MEPENSFPCSQESTTVSVLSHMYPVHIVRPSSFKIHFNFTLPSTPRSPKWALSFRFSDGSFVCNSYPPHANCVLRQPRPPHLHVC